MTSDQSRPGGELLAVVTLWRLVVAGAAWFGLHHVIGYTGTYRWEGLEELSQLASAAVAVCYVGLALYPLLTGGRRHEPRSPWLRGGLAVVMALVCLTATLVLPNGGQLHHVGFLFEHLITPVLVILDYILVGRSRRRTRWWYPLSWVALPLAYFAFMMINDPREYGSMFDPDNPDFALTVGAFFAGVVIAGYVLMGLARLTAPRPADEDEDEDDRQPALTTQPVEPPELAARD